MKIKDFKKKYRVIAKTAKEYEFDIHDDLGGASYNSLSNFIAIVGYDVYEKATGKNVLSIDNNGDKEAVEEIKKHFKLSK